MYENLQLLNEHHLSDLKREAQNDQLVREVLKSGRKNKSKRGAGLLAMLANSIHIR